MMIFKKLVLILFILLTGCAGDDGKYSWETPTPTPTPTPSPTPSPTQTAANIIGGCAWLPQALPVIKYGPHTTNTGVRIYVANENGQPILEVSKSTGSAFGVKDFDPSSWKAHDDAIKNYPNSYLLIQCDFADHQVSKPFTLSGLFKISESYNKTLVTSIFSDIIYKAIKKTSINNLNSYQTILHNRFGSSSFVKDVPIFAWNIQSSTFGNESEFYRTHSLIANNAVSYVKSDFSAYTDYAATHLTGNCTDVSLCTFLGVR
jgi:hypothetical protein